MTLIIRILPADSSTDYRRDARSRLLHAFRLRVARRQAGAHALGTRAPMGSGKHPDGPPADRPDALHDPLPLVVGHREMLQRPVVPQGDVVGFPGPAHGELR